MSELVAAEPVAAEPVAAEPVAAEPVETGLRIQPPATGEPVAYQRPGRPATEPLVKPADPEPADASAAPASVSAEETLLKKEVAASQRPAATEPTIHHG